MKRKAIRKGKSAAVKTAAIKSAAVKTAAVKTARGKAIGKSKTARSGRVRPKRIGSAKAGPADVVDAMVASNAQALGLPVEPAWRDSVKFNLGLILRFAALVEEFPLPDDAEPAPVFHA